MKGVIFNAVEESVRAEFGEDAWDDLLEAAGASGSYTSLGTYPDAEMQALVEAACDMLAMSQPDLLRHLGRKAFAYLAGRNPDLMGSFTDTRSVLLGLNGVIHPEVRKVYPGADAPTFGVNAQSADSLSLTYRSNRGMCHFAEGLTLGAADHFGEQVAVTQPACLHEGADHCELRVAWTAGAHG